MSKRTDIEFTAGQVVLVERTPLPGIVAMDRGWAGQWEEAVMDVTVAGDPDVALASVKALARAAGMKCQVHGMEVRP